MWRTRITDLLGIPYPILQAGMSGPGNGALAAAVSNAGGLGMVGFNPGAPPSDGQVDNMRRHIREAKSLTKKPIGVNIPLPAGVASSMMLVKGRVEQSIEMAIEEKVAVIVTSGGDPTRFTPLIKSHGVKVVHTVMDDGQAQKAEAAGVDAVIAMGVESGGLLGPLELTTFMIVQLVRRAVNIPVVAAGGIADARGFVAALALGADAIQMGTRFVATTECHAHENFKNAITRATSKDTVVSGRNTRIRRRDYKNSISLELADMDRRGCSQEEIKAVMGMGRDRIAMIEGDMENGLASTGASSALIRDIVPAGEVITRIIKEAHDIAAEIERSRVS